MARLSGRTVDSFILYYCGFCAKTFKRESWLEKHIQTSHGQKEDPSFSSQGNNYFFEINNQVKTEPSDVQDESEELLEKQTNYNGARNHKAKKKRGIYENLYNHEAGSSAWSCNACSAIFASDHGIYRHLKKTKCGFGDQENYKPKKSWKSKYLRQGDKWICCNCGAVYQSDHGVTRHLQKTKCGEAEVSDPLYRSAGGRLLCNKCDNEYESVGEVEKHVKNEHSGAAEGSLAEQRRDYSNLYTRHGTTFTCAGCQVEYQTDRGVQRHLVNTRCGFGARFRSAPKMSYAGLYSREGSRWVCLACNNSWGSDRGIHHHLRGTRCGFGEKEPVEKIKSAGDDGDSGMIMKAEISQQKMIDDGYMDVPLE